MSAKPQRKPPEAQKPRATVHKPTRDPSAMIAASKQHLAAVASHPRIASLLESGLPKSMDPMAASGSFSQQASTPQASTTSGYLDYEEGRVYPTGARLLLPLTHVRENPLNPRVFFSLASLSDLAQSLRENGQMEAAQVYAADSDGRFMLRSGHRRYRALKSLGQKYIRVEIVEKPADELREYFQARDLNAQHEGQSLADDAVSVARLMEGPNAPSQDELAAALHMSKAALSKLLAVAKLPHQVLEVFADNRAKFGLALGYAVFQFWQATGSNDTETAKLVERVVAEDLSIKKVDAMVAALTAHRSLKAERARPLQLAQLSNGAKGELKIFPNRVVLEAKGLDAARRKALYEKILAVIREEGLAETSEESS